ncbi:hypothetical protein TorRG33x02_351310 [Trema orientale]|uniref:Uncharacterized protein n=1 Tax=Trema orientale TaxID=63057 RepID=A0A2P5AFX5_TREOI|nr:hypothetical protein TorRG33x02_351310 [Trema orientale]
MAHLSSKVKNEAMNVTAAPGNYCSYNYNDTQPSLYVSSNFHNMANTSNSPFGYNHTYPNVSSVQQQQQQQQYYSELSHLPDQSGQFLINQQYNQVYPEVSPLPDQSGQCSIIQQYNQVYQTTVEPSMLYKDSTHVVTETISQIEYHIPVSSLANDNGSGGASHPLPQLIPVGGCNENQISTNYSGFEDATISNNYEQEKASDSTLIQQQQHHDQQYCPNSRTIPTMPLVQQYNKVCQANGEPASIFCEESTHVVTESTNSSNHEQVEANDSDSTGWVWVNPWENMAAGEKVEHSSFDP